VRDESVQRGGLHFRPWYGPCHRRSALSPSDYYWEQERIGVAGMCCYESLYLATARPHSTGPGLASKPALSRNETVTRRLVFGLRLLLPFLSSGLRTFMPTTRILAQLKSTRMKLAAPIVSESLLSHGEHQAVQHPATFTCARPGREERSAALLVSTVCVRDTLDARSAASAVRHLSPSCAKALNLPGL
jgi:hypothetical protein